VLIVGFLLGVKHALEADHIAAVASLATRAASMRETLRVATVWGLGHTVTLVLCGAVVIGFEASVPEWVAAKLEVVVGVMLILLGIDVLRRLRARHVHFHMHAHDDGVRHFHAHGHVAEAAHDPAQHTHAHGGSVLTRALLVGSVHGLAGTAALTVLSLHVIHSAVRAVVYLFTFGAGTILGMALFSLVIAVPLRQSQRLPRWAAMGMEATLAITSIILGAWITASTL